MGLDIRLQTMIRVNGKEYDSVEKMPTELRQAYERALAKPTAGLDRTVWQQAVSSGKIVFNVKEYAGIDQMPSDVRGLYQRVMAALDTDGDGVPTMPEGGGPLGTGVSMSNPQATKAALQAFDDVPLFIRPSTATATVGIVEPETSTSRVFLIGGVLLAFGLLLVMLH